MEISSGDSLWYSEAATLRIRMSLGTNENWSGSVRKPLNSCRILNILLYSKGKVFYCTVNLFRSLERIVKSIEFSSKQQKLPQSKILSIITLCCLEYVNNINVKVLFFVVPNLCINLKCISHYLRFITFLPIPLL